MLNITFNENNIKNIFKNILINSSLFVKDNENNVPPKKGRCSESYLCLNIIWVKFPDFFL